MNEIHGETPFDFSRNKYVSEIKKLLKVKKKFYLHFSPLNMNPPE
jgi:hypothetical protein